MTADGPSVETRFLPLSGWLFQWRADGYWRELNDKQHRAELAGGFVPGEDDWIRWTGSTQRMAKGGWSLRPRWQLVYSELTPGAPPRVVLEDATEPPILQIGGVWMCEWVSTPRPVTVMVGSESWVVPFGRRPHYLPEDYEG